MAKMRHMIEILSQAIKALQWWGPTEACLDISNAKHNPMDILEGDPRWERCYRRRKLLS